MEEAIEFDAAGVTLRGKFFRPDGAVGPGPVVICQGGLGGPAESSYPFAGFYTNAGLSVLIYDHRYTGYSDGQPRQQFDPWQQCRDLRHAITYLSLRKDVDAERIGLWGISIGGANSLFVAALDRRVRCVVAMVPPVSGVSAKQLHPAEEMRALESLIYSDRMGQFRGEPARTIPLYGAGEPGRPSMFQRQAGNDMMQKMLGSLPSFRNEITVSTLDFLFEMEVRAYAERISAPLLLVLAAQDTVAPVAEAREMFERVPEPKTKLEFPGEHYQALQNHMPDMMREAIAFLARELSSQHEKG
jgi:pimeloyl-ACP methyl ester carboxylesterase